jgi:hypothetical protein
MPLPRALFCADAPADHDLKVTQGSWASDISGEVFISAPHPDTFGGSHPFYGDGMTYRLSLQAGTFGAGADTFAWRQRRIDSASARLRSKRRPLRGGADPQRWWIPGRSVQRGKDRFLTNRHPQRAGHDCALCAVPGVDASCPAG